MLRAATSVVLISGFLIGSQVGAQELSAPIALIFEYHMPKLDCYRDTQQGNANPHEG